MLTLIQKYQFLFEELVSRDFKKKYKRTVLGMGWSVLSPLLQLLVMSLVFGQFFAHDQPHYADESGTVKPLERGTLRVGVTGGHLLGLGSGCPYNAAGFLTDTTDTYYGRALAVVQADGTGPVGLTVTDGRLEGSCRVALD